MFQNKRQPSLWSAVALLCLSATGCSHRSEAEYATDTNALLAQRDAPIRSCYDTHLKASPGLAGEVAVDFVVQKKTGEIVQATINPSATTAGPELVDCVINSIAGQRLSEPDRRDGHASYTWSFTAVEGQPEVVQTAEPAGS